MISASELEARRAKAREERALLAKARAERDTQSMLVAEVEAEERALRDEQALAVAEEEYGAVGSRIAVVQTDLGMVIVKRPNALHWRRFQDKGDKIKSQDFEQLVRPCLVHPDVSAFERILEELPATLIHFADAVATLAGARSKEVAGK